MLVAAVAGVEHRAVDLVRDQLHRAGRIVADHDHVRSHRVERRGGVEQRLALLHARLRRMHVHDVHAEPLARDLEREERARRILEERVDLREAGEQRVVLRGRAVECDPLLRLVEEVEDFVGLEPLDAGQVPMREGVNATVRSDAFGSGELIGH